MTKFEACYLSATHALIIYDPISLFSFIVCGRLAKIKYGNITGSVFWNYTTENLTSSTTKPFLPSTQNFKISTISYFYLSPMSKEWFGESPYILLS